MRILSTNSSIPVNQMKNGQIAIIRAWPVSLYIGNIVQKIEGKIIQLGSENYWDIDSLNMTDEKLFQVEILPPGTKLEI